MLLKIIICSLAQFMRHTEQKQSQLSAAMYQVKYKT